jgi:two-component system sensor histidine kinase TctE
VLAFLRRDGPRALRYAVTGEDGALLAGEPGVPLAPAGGNPAFGHGVLHDQPVRVATFRTAVAGRAIRVSVAENVSWRESTARYFIASTLARDALQLIVLVLLVLLGVRQGLRPLLALRDRLAARSAGELEPLDESSVPAELRTLVGALNGLFARVRAATAAQQEFVAAAAHQLRTPLAGMQAQLELLERDPAAQAVRERIRALRDGVKRLAHTANQLLALARAEDSATLARDFRAVDLSVLIEDAVTAQLDRALAKGIDLGAETAAATVTGVEWLLRELLANLIDNALTYTPAGGVVTLRCGAADGGVYLEVEDDGPGIPPEERPRVVERFQRAAGAGGSGSGLGLAIVSDIVALHRARFELGEGAGGRGTRARVEFPAAAAPPAAQGL